MDGKIYITISDEREGGGGSVGSFLTKQSQVNTPSKSQNNQSNVLSRYAEFEFFNLVKQTAEEVVNYTISNYGNFTGNYLAQKNIDIAMGNLGPLVSIGLSTLEGFRVGGWVGALIGGSVATASAGVSFGLKEKTAYFENSKTNREIEKIRELSGLNSLTNNSR